MLYVQKRFCLIFFPSYQRCIQNLAEHPRLSFLRKQLTVSAVNYFCKKLHLTCSTGFWILGSCKSNTSYVAISETQKQNPLNTLAKGRKYNVHKTSGIRLRNDLCVFNLRPESVGTVVGTFMIKVDGRYTFRRLHWLLFKCYTIFV